tara:strand:- start:522 stop:722 length:201 start_codon:yes stop_codon:yes gene_type:complete
MLMGPHIRREEINTMINTALSFYLLISLVGVTIIAIAWIMFLTQRLNQLSSTLREVLINYTKENKE